MDQRRDYHGGFVWPVILIGAGIVFLLNNLGIIDWSVWQTLWRLWPILLIAVGLDLLVGRRFPLGSALLALLLVVVLVLGVRGTIPGVIAASSVTVDRTETISQDLGDSERASVEINFSAGNLNVDALPEGSPHLIQGSVDLSRNERLSKDFGANNGVARLILDSQGSWSMGPDVLGGSEKRWDLGLTQAIPLDLVVDSGAGKANLDLTGLNLRRLDLKGGVGQVTVKLPAAGRYEVDVDGGVGQIVLIVPEDLAARIQTDGGIGGVRAEGDFSRAGDVYSTGDFSTAENRADVQVNNGIGQIVLRSVSE